MDSFMHDWFWALFYGGVMSVGALFFWMLFRGDFFRD